MQSWLLAAMALALAQPSGSDSADGHRNLAPRPARLSAHQVTVRTDVGSYCTSATQRPGQQTGTGICVDAAAPRRPPRPRLLVAPGDVVSFQFPDNPDIDDIVRRVDIDLARIHNGDYESLEWTARASRVPGGRLWTVQLPHRLGDRPNALGLFVRYRSGDASFVGGIELVRPSDL
jgi:hypothetical protein